MSREGDAAAGGLEEIQRVRRDKARQMAEAGWPSFPAGAKVTHTAQAVREHPGEIPSDVSPEAEIFWIAGRVLALRVMGKAAFADVHDRTGKLQVQLKKDLLGDDVYAKVKLLDLGDFIEVSGPRFLTRTGELTIQARTVRLVGKSLHPVPDSYFGVQDTELRYRQRYLDLLANPASKEVFRKRSQTVRFIRRFLEDRDFLEVETPMLHGLVSGAAARPFRTHHHALDMALNLRIAPELHLKRLVVGGFDRVFEINRNFRNEGLSTRHNPEFTMLEFYQAYATYTDLMDLTETLLRETALAVTGSMSVPHGGWEEGSSAVMIDFERPFRRIAVREGLAEKLPGVDVMSHAALAGVAEAHGLDARAPLGKLQMELFEHLWQPELVQPTFVVDFPVEVSPLARRKDSDPSLTDRFELYVTQKEIANAFTELNDPDDQRGRFRAQVEARQGGADETMDYDEDYCHALEIGLPPTAGEGLGIDRLVMVLTNQPSIRDVILFPQQRQAGA